MRRLRSRAPRCDRRGRFLERLSLIHIYIVNKLFVYLKEDKKETILGPLFKMLEASFELFVPLVVASMIDVGICLLYTSRCV